MRRVAQLASVVVLAALSSGGAVAPGERDVYGRPVPQEPGRPAIVLYANRSSETAVGESLASLSARLADVAPLVLVRVDLRGLPWFFRGFADHDMRDRFKGGLRRFYEYCAKMGITPPPHADSRLFFIADPAGNAHAAVGLPKGFHQAIAIAYGPDGRELARVPFPQEASVLEARIRGTGGTN
jgi:hypothetical protein